MIHQKPTNSLDLPPAVFFAGRLFLDQFRHCLAPASMVIAKTVRRSLGLNRANRDIIN